MADDQGKTIPLGPGGGEKEGGETLAMGPGQAAGLASSTGPGTSDSARDGQTIAQGEPPSTKPYGEPRPWPTAGSEILKNYELVRELGRGAMGVVYEARELGSDRRVAVKIVSTQTGGEDLDLLARESSVMARATHPNSVFIYGAERSAGAAVIVMELVRGGTLADLLSVKKSLEVKRAVDITLQLIEGLLAFDAHGIVHRDIKPANIFMTREGKPKLGDLGLASSSEAPGAETQKGRFMGTPIYSSPEQLRGDPIDRRSDIYSLIAVLYQMLTGHPPIEAPDRITLIARAASVEPKALREWDPNAPKGLEKLITRGLAKDPAKRFANYEDLKKALIPYGTQALTPGKVATRIVAYFIDNLALQIPVGLLAVGVLLWGAESRLATSFLQGLQSGEGIPPLQLFLLNVLQFVLTFLFFAAPEAIWGRSLGKAVCGLKVVDAAGTPATASRVFARTLFFVLPPALVNLTVTPWVMSGGGEMSPYMGFVGFLPMIWWVAIVSTMSVSNGFQGLHERVTRTRVIFHDPWWRKLEARRLRGRVQQVLPSMPTQEEAKRRFGGYLGVQELSSENSGSLWLAFDPALSRWLWVRLHGEGEAPASAARRNLDRSRRLRWVGVGEEDGAKWDAFVPPETYSTFDRMETKYRRRAWSEGYPLLGELARELITAREEGTLGDRLRLGQICFDREGELLFLDWAPHERGDERDPEFGTDDAGLVGFFRVLALALQDGRVRTEEESADATNVSRLSIAETVPDLWIENGKAADALHALTTIAPAGREEVRALSRLMRLKQHVIGSMLFLMATPFWAFFFALALRGGRAWEGLAWSSIIAAGVGLIFAATAAALRGGPVFFFDKVVVSRLDGQPAGFWRRMLRSAALWFPIFISLTIVARLIGTIAAVVAADAVLLLILGVGVLHSIYSPTRNVLDYAASTYLRLKSGPVPLTNIFSTAGKICAVFALLMVLGITFMAIGVFAQSRTTGEGGAALLSQLTASFLVIGAMGFFAGLASVAFGALGIRECRREPKVGGRIGARFALAVGCGVLLYLPPLTTYCVMKSGGFEGLRLAGVGMVGNRSNSPPKELGDIVFSDDFDGGALADGWNPSNDWQVSDGAVGVVPAERGGRRTAALVVGQEELQDYLLEVDVTLRESSRFFVLLRYRPLGSRGHRAIFFGSDERMTLWGVTPETLVGLEAPSIRGDLPEGKQSFHVQVEARGSRFRAWIDGKYYGDYEDSAYEGGSVALGYFSSEGAPSPLYDNFKIFALEATPAPGSHR